MVWQNHFQCDKKNTRRILNWRQKWFSTTFFTNDINKFAAKNRDLLCFFFCDYQFSSAARDCVDGSLCCAQVHILLAKYYVAAKVCARACVIVFSECIPLFWIPWKTAQSSKFCILYNWKRTNVKTFNQIKKKNAIEFPSEIINYKIQLREKLHLWKPEKINTPNLICSKNNSFTRSAQRIQRAQALTCQAIDQRSATPFSNGDMSNRIQLALKATIRFHVAAIVAFTWFSLAKFVATEIAEQTKLFPQQDEGKRNFTFLYSPFLSLEINTIEQKSSDRSTRFVGLTIFAMEIVIFLDCFLICDRMIVFAQAINRINLQFKTDSNYNLTPG